MGFWSIEIWEWSLTRRMNIFKWKKIVLEDLILGITNTSLHRNKTKMRLWVEEALEYYLPKFANNIIQAIKIVLFQPHGTLKKLLAYKVPPKALCLSLKLFWNRLLTRIILESIIYYSFLTNYCVIF